MHLFENSTNFAKKQLPSGQKLCLFFTGKTISLKAHQNNPTLSGKTAKHLQLRTVLIANELWI